MPMWPNHVMDLEPTQRVLLSSPQDGTPELDHSKASPTRRRSDFYFCPPPLGLLPPKYCFWTWVALLNQLFPVTP